MILDFRSKYFTAFKNTRKKPQVMCNKVLANENVSCGAVPGLRGARAAARWGCLAGNRPQGRPGEAAFRSLRCRKTRGNSVVGGYISISFFKKKNGCTGRLSTLRWPNESLSNHGIVFRFTDTVFS